MSRYNLKSRRKNLTESQESFILCFKIIPSFVSCRLFCSDVPDFHIGTPLDLLVSVSPEMPIGGAATPSYPCFIAVLSPNRRSTYLIKSLIILSSIFSLSRCPDLSSEKMPADFLRKAGKFSLNIF
jgi:hypothetical protein